MPDGAHPLGDFFASQAAGLDLADLPAETVGKAKLCLKDYLSCVFGALAGPGSTVYRSYAQALHDDAGAPVIGTGYRLAAPEAAFMNSALGASASRSDIHAASASHPGIVIFPTLLALAAVAGPFSGSRFLAATVAGYEAMGRIGRAVATPEAKARFRATGMCGPYASGLAGATLWGLDEAGLANAAAIAGNTSGGLMEWAWSGENDLHLQPAFGARAGVSGVMLARHGMRASRSILDGRSGLLRTFAEHREIPDHLTRAWKPAFELDGMGYKAVPVCVFAQAAAFAARDMVAAQSVPADAIARIEIGTYHDALVYPGCADRDGIASAQAARMSIPYVVASTLALGELGDGNFDAFDHPKVRRLLSLVELTEVAGYSARFPGSQGATVTVRLTTGQQLKTAIDDLPPFGAAEVMDRFRTCADRIVGEDRRHKIEAAIDRLEEVEDIAVLIPEMQNQPRTAAQ